MRHVNVRTSTVIPVHPDNRYLVAVLQHQPTKHNGRKTAPGGKATGGVPNEQCAHDEFGQEMGGKGATLDKLTLFAVRMDLNADVRQVTLKKATDGFCPPEREGEMVMAHYGAPDFIYTATVCGEPAPNDGEAVKVEWFDVRDLRPTELEKDSAFGAQHDLLLLVYRLVLDGAYVDDFDFGNFTNLRAQLLAEFAGK